MFLLIITDNTVRKGSVQEGFLLLINFYCNYKYKSQLALLFTETVQLLITVLY
jgi:hypothetical protein